MRAQGAALEKEVCLGCRDAIRELLGTLVVPPGQRGTVLGGSGEAGTRVVGAVVPGLSEQPELWILGPEHGRVALLERLEWGAFEPARMTYPERQGAIDHRIWQLYREHLEVLRSRLEGQP